MSRHMRSLITGHHSQRAATRVSTRWGAILVALGALTLLALSPSSQAAEPGPPAPKPGTVVPIPGGAKPGEPPAPAGRVVPPTGPRPTGSTTRTPYVGPTPDLTAVANAIGLRAKSLTILVTAAPGLSLTKPVTISIAYISPAGGIERLTQSYVAATGNHFLRDDPEGDGKPRLVHLDITLTEPKQGGGIYSFNVPGDVSLDPLYDVTISPLQFSLIDDCALIGASDIALGWVSPGGRVNGFKFKTSGGQGITINQFAWAGTEVSASRYLRTPDVIFSSKSEFWSSIGDWLASLPWSVKFQPGAAPPPPIVNLVPGKTQTIARNLDESSGECRAYIQYTITYQLRWYPYL